MTHSPNAIPIQRTAEEQRVFVGTIFGFLTYSMWGVLPIYFRALEPASSWEILAHRIVWSLAFCAVIWAWKRNLSWLRPLLRHPRRLALLALAAHVLAINWAVFIWAVNDGNVVETSLGYFINPLILVVMGVLLLGEQLTRLQWTAIGFGVLAVAFISLDYGRLPWVALSLALSFATYGYIKKQLGAHIGALESMTIETISLIPLASGLMIWIGRSDDATFLSEGTGHTLLMVASGVATAIPLIFFAAAASRVPLTTMGLLQYIAPVGSFMVGVLLFNEVVPGPRWVGFGLVWIGLAILTVDTLRRARSNRRLRQAAAITT